MKFKVPFKVLFIILITISASYAGWDPLMNWIGGVGNCEDNSEAENPHLQCNLLQSITPVAPEETSNLATINHELVFQQLADRSHRSAECQRDQLREYFTNSTTREDINSSAIATLEEHFDSIKELHNEITRIKSRNRTIKEHLYHLNNLRRIRTRSNGEIYAHYDNPDSEDFWAHPNQFDEEPGRSQAMERDRIRLNEENESNLNQINMLKGFVDQIVNAFPLGERSGVSSMYKKLIKDNDSFNRHIISQQLNSRFPDALNSEIDTLDSSIEYFEDRLRRGRGLEYNLRDRDRASFVRSGAFNEIVSSHDYDYSEGLLCRTHRRYVTANDRVNTGVNVALAVASFVPVAGQLATGARLLTVGTRALSAASAVTLGVASTTFAYQQISEGCFTDDRTNYSSSEPACYQGSLAEGVRENSDAASCISAVTLSALAAGTNLFSSGTRSALNRATGNLFNRTTFQRAFQSLSKSGRQNVLRLREWARSRGYIRLRDDPEIWGIPARDGEPQFWGLKIKAEPSPNDPFSAYPRFDARIRAAAGECGENISQCYYNPFTQQSGNRHIGTHIQLDPDFPPPVLPDP